MSHETRAQLTTGPASEPVTTAQAKAQLNVDFDTDDTYIDLLVAAARTTVENHTQRGLINQTWTLKLDDFPDTFTLPRAPLSSVTSITYIDGDGNSQTLATSVYDVDTQSEPGRVLLAYGQTWPTTRDQVNAVTVTYVVGYGSAASSVPEPFKHAIKLLVAHWYHQREAVTSNSAPREVPFTVDALLTPYRLWQIA